jgi:two-component system nitrogen regulation sensor histidine kinase GlnL
MTALWSQPVLLESIQLARLPLPLMLLDFEACVLQTNLLAQEALGKSDKRLIGLNLAEIFSPSIEIERLLSRLAPYGGGASEHQIFVRERNMPVSLHVGMHEQGITAIFVPETCRTEVELHARRHEMAEAVARIAQEMAHEVKNPLAALRGATQWLSEQDESESLQEAVRHMLADIDRIRDRIDAFLLIGPRAKAQMEMTNIHALIQDVIYYQEGIHVSRVFDPSLPETMVHPARMAQAFENLWRNAVEAADSQIEWQTRMAPLVNLPGHDGQVMEVSITNDGATVPEALRERMFEPYITGKARGNGLGLALVERVMLEHGGRVVARCEQGRTTMVLHIPIKGENN